MTYTKGSGIVHPFRDPQFLRRLALCTAVALAAAAYVAWLVRSIYSYKVN